MLFPMVLWTDKMASDYLDAALIEKLQRSQSRSEQTLFEVQKMELALKQAPAGGLGGD